jgi:hypothetical protein
MMGSGSGAGSGSGSGSAALCWSYAPTNFDPCGLPAPAALHVTADTTINADTTTLPKTVVSQEGGSQLTVIHLETLTIDSAPTLTLTGSTPIAFAEVYLALQTNQVDAQENPLSTIKSMKFYEVQKHIALTSHFVATKAVTVSEKTWAKLSEQQRGWLVEAAKTGRAVTNKLIMDDEANLVAFLKEQGVAVTEPDLAPFREAMKPYYKNLEDQFGAGSIDKIMSVQ